MFQSKPTEDNIIKENVDEYKAFLDHYKFNKKQDSKRKIIQIFYPSNTPSRQRQTFIVPEKEVHKTPVGRGIRNSEPSTLLIPSDPDKLKDDLMLQLADVEAGNNNNFNYTNALMKEMLSQK